MEQSSQQEKYQAGSRAEISRFLIITIALLSSACSQSPWRNNTLAHNAAQPAQAAIGHSADSRADQAAGAQLSAPTPCRDITAEHCASGTQHADIWARIRSGYQMDVYRDDARIDREISWFGRNQDHIDKITERATPYIPYVVETIEKHELPLEIALLPVVESGYNPDALSSSQAAGIWQFIPTTGKLYNLRQNWWYDGRRDIRRSTEAAAAYLAHLAAHYHGDWPLALAAYNAGQGRVDRAIRHNAKRGRPTDYWSLQLSDETMAYVPRLLAVARIIDDPAAYGFTLQPIPNAAQFDVVDTGGQISLPAAADMAGVSLDQLRQLNPGFKQLSTTPRGPFELLLPPGRAEAFTRQLALLDEQRPPAPPPYRVNAGDTLARIAARHDTSVSTLKQLNRLESDTIHVDQMLAIPGPTTDSMILEQPTEKAEQRIQYRVQRGDSLWKISRKYAVPVTSIARWNDLPSDQPLQTGAVLTLWRPITDGGNPGRKVRYKIKSGDTLTAIATRYNIDLTDLLTWNPLDHVHYLRAGEHLTLFLDTSHAH